MSKIIDKDTYQTPQPLFTGLHNRFKFAADIAASDDNHLLPAYLTKEDNALITPWRMMCPTGGYVWCNPPYSKVAPWVSKARQERRNGVGTVMLVFCDPSSSWYSEAVETADVIWHVVRGRISFINPQTGKKAGGNDRPSMVIIWHPNGGNFPLQTNYVTRDSLVAGQKLEFLL